MNASHDERERIAREAYEALGPSPSRQMILQVACPHSHHLAGIYDTGAGRVFHAVLHSKSHGRRDRFEGGHHGDRLGVDWFDLLDAGPGMAVADELAAGCGCGPYTLSRELLVKHVADGERRVILD